KATAAATKRRWFRSRDPYRPPHPGQGHSNQNSCSSKSSPRRKQRARQDGRRRPLLRREREPIERGISYLCKLFQVDLLEYGRDLSHSSDGSPQACCNFVDADETSSLT